MSESCDFRFGFWLCFHKSIPHSFDPQFFFFREGIAYLRLGEKIEKLKRKRAYFCMLTELNTVECVCCSSETCSPGSYCHLVEEIGKQ